MKADYNGYGGVDRWIRESFFTDWEYKGVMVEVGGGLPDWINNSYHWRINGWKTLCVEPNPLFAQRHREMGSEVWEGACADWSGDGHFIIVGESERGDGSQHSFSHLSGSDWNMSSSMRDIYLSTEKREIPIKVRTLTEILTECGIESVDILSIDVEGGEIGVLKGLDWERWRPKVIQIENITHNDYQPYLNGYHKVEDKGGDEIWVKD
jgi:FkbM family methyltransferase